MGSNYAVVNQEANIAVDGVFGGCHFQWLLDLSLSLYFVAHFSFLFFINFRTASGEDA